MGLLATTRKAEAAFNGKRLPNLSSHPCLLTARVKEFALRALAHLIPKIDHRYSQHLFYVRSYPTQHTFQKS